MNAHKIERKACEIYNFEISSIMLYLELFNNVLSRIVNKKNYKKFTIKMKTKYFEPS